MYVAKRSSTGYQIYDPASDHNTLRRLKLTGKLRSAIERDRFIMHYQPIVRLDGRPELCVEGLVRWEDPEFGLVMPDEFIELAETSDLIGLLTDRTLEQSLAQCVTWRNSGHDITIAANISARLMQDAEFPAVVTKKLDDLGADPRWLTIEITENAFFSDPQRALNATRQINRLGIQLAIDDFGVGYSSFAYLKNLPVHQLKIDKSFISDISSNQEDEFIVESIITLCQGLGLQVVAEGVEDEQIYRQLREMGCDLAQGFWMSPPVVAGELVPWWDKWQRRQPGLTADTPLRVRLGGS
jgi:EAL domain-containing protein (putative c-di-GMP-specific phosphodiesterase class I)